MGGYKGVRVSYKTSEPIEGLGSKGDVVILGGSGGLSK